MLRDGIADAPAFVLKTGNVSVRGLKVTLDDGPAALVDFHTPPPVVPTYTVLPLVSFGSIAIALTRPVTAPYERLAIWFGPTGCHGAPRLESSGDAACCAIIVACCLR